MNRRFLALGLMIGMLVLCGCVPLRTVLEAAVPDGADTVTEVQPSAETLPAELIRIVDGDTIAVVPSAEMPATNDRGTEHYVRLLSIDAPEMNKSGDSPPECGSQESTDHLVAMLNGVTSIELVFDARSDHTDRFGRSLAYVLADGRDLGAAQVEAGFAAAWYPQSEPEPERFLQYAQIQQEASDAGLGAHASCSSIGR